LHLSTDRGSADTHVGPFYKFKSFCKRWRSQTPQFEGSWRHTQSTQPIGPKRLLAGE